MENESFEDRDEVEDRIVEDLVLYSIENLLLSMQARKRMYRMPEKRAHSTGISLSNWQKYRDMAFKTGNAGLNEINMFRSFNLSILVKTGIPLYLSGISFIVKKMLEVPLTGLLFEKGKENNLGISGWN